MATSARESGGDIVKIAANSRVDIQAQQKAMQTQFNEYYIKFRQEKSYLSEKMFNELYGKEMKKQHDKIVELHQTRSQNVLKSWERVLSLTQTGLMFLGSVTFFGALMPATLFRITEKISGHVSEGLLKKVIQRKTATHLANTNPIEKVRMLQDDSVKTAKEAATMVDLSEGEIQKMINDLGYTPAYLSQFKTLSGLSLATSSDVFMVVNAKQGKITGISQLKFKNVYEAEAFESMLSEAMKKANTISDKIEYLATFANIRPALIEAEKVKVSNPASIIQYPVRLTGVPSSQATQKINIHRDQPSFSAVIEEIQNKYKLNPILKIDLINSDESSKIATMEDLKNAIERSAAITVMATQAGGGGLRVLKIKYKGINQIQKMLDNPNLNLDEKKQFCEQFDKLLISLKLAISKDQFSRLIQVNI